MVQHKKIVVNTSNATVSATLGTGEETTDVQVETPQNVSFDVSDAGDITITTDTQTVELKVDGSAEVGQTDSKITISVPGSTVTVGVTIKIVLKTINIEIDSLNRIKFSSSVGLPEVPKGSEVTVKDDNTIEVVVPLTSDSLKF